jgi:hypothetical protein
MYHMRWNSSSNISICQAAQGFGVCVPRVFKIHQKRQPQVCCPQCLKAYKMAVTLQAV